MAPGEIFHKCNNKTSKTTTKPPTWLRLAFSLDSSDIRVLFVVLSFPICISYFSDLPSSWCQLEEYKFPVCVVIRDVSVYIKLVVLVVVKRATTWSVGDTCDQKALFESSTTRVNQIFRLTFNSHHIRDHIHVGRHH